MGEKTYPKILKVFTKGKYVRGMYYEPPEWTKDRSTNYYQGANISIEWPLLKLAIVIVYEYLLYKYFGMFASILGYIILCLSYQIVIAKIYGVIVMP